MVGSSKSDSYWRSAIISKRQFLSGLEVKWPVQLDEAHPVIHIYRRDSETCQYPNALGH